MWCVRQLICHELPCLKWLVYGPGMEDNILWTILEWIVESCWHFLYVTYVFLVSLLFSSLHFHAVKMHFISTRSSVHRQSPLFVELCVASSLYAPCSLVRALESSNTRHSQILVEVRGTHSINKNCWLGFWGTPLKTKMTLENPHVQSAIHLHSWWIFPPVMLVFGGGMF